MFTPEAIAAVWRQTQGQPWPVNALCERACFRGEASRPDGDVDVEKLMEAFQTFFREHSEHWLGRFDYQEAY